MAQSLDRWPVLVGVGECVQRGKDLSVAKDPVDLMVDAVRAAAADAGWSDVSALDRLDVIQQFSWPVHDAPGEVAKALGAQPTWRRYGPVGGETPVAFIHEAALAIARGDSQVAVVVGGESQYSVNAAQASGVTLPWRQRDDETPLLRGAVYQHEMAKRLGVAIPATIYPLFENAALAALGLTPAQAHAESADLWSRFSQVAAGNPVAWSQQAFSPEEVAEPSLQNRRVAWPYTKRMVANPAVNQAAAVLLTSRQRALAWGVAPERLVYVHTGAAADDPKNVLERDDLAVSHGRDAVLDTMRERIGEVSSLSALELYSCFPVVPKLARRRLGLAAQHPMTVTGGLSFFGAPLNNYMGHAAVAMVRDLRAAAPGAKGLLYGQGGNMTKHHALLLGREPGSVEALHAPVSVQAQADAARAAPPNLNMAHQGVASVETFTVMFARNGELEQGVVVLRNAARERLLARVEADDAHSLSVLMDSTRSPVGHPGRVHTRIDGTPIWQAN